MELLKDSLIRQRDIHGFENIYYKVFKANTTVTEKERSEEFNENDTSVEVQAVDLLHNAAEAIREGSSVLYSLDLSQLRLYVFSEISFETQRLEPGNVFFEDALKIAHLDCEQSGRCTPQALYDGARSRPILVEIDRNSEVNVSANDNSSILNGPLIAQESAEHQKLFEQLVTALMISFSFHMTSKPGVMVPNWNKFVLTNHQVNENAPNFETNTPEPSSISFTVSFELTELGKIVMRSQIEPLLRWSSLGDKVGPDGHQTSLRPHIIRMAGIGKTAIYWPTHKGLRSSDSATKGLDKIKSFLKEPEMTFDASHRNMWRKIAEKGLQNHGIGPGILSASRQWVKTTVLCDSCSQPRSNKGLSICSEDLTVEWPADLCYSLRPSNECEMEISSVESFRLEAVSGVDWFQSLSKKRYRDPLEFAVSWMEGRDLRKQESDDRRARRMAEAAGEREGTEHREIIDTLSPNDPRLLMYQDVQGIYPTPSDGFGAQATPGSYSAEVVASHSTSANPMEASMFSTKRKEEMPGQHGRTKEEVDLEEDDRDMFNLEHLTEADFDFFDDQKSAGSNRLEPTHQHDKSRSAEKSTFRPSIQAPDHAAKHSIDDDIIMKDVSEVEAGYKEPEYESPDMVSIQDNSLDGGTLTQGREVIIPTVQPERAIPPHEGGIEERKGRETEYVDPAKMENTDEMFDKKYRGKGRFGFSTLKKEKKNTGQPQDSSLTLGSKAPTLVSSSLLDPRNRMPRTLSSSSDSTDSSLDESVEDRGLLGVLRTESEDSTTAHRTLFSGISDSEVRGYFYSLFADKSGEIKSFDETEGFYSDSTYTEPYLLSDASDRLEQIEIAQLISEQVAHSTQINLPGDVPEAICPNFLPTLDVQYMFSTIENTFERAFAANGVTNVSDYSSTSNGNSDEDTRCIELSAPQIEVRRRGSPWKFNHTVTSVWESMDIEPAHGEKEVVAFCVYPWSEEIDGTIERFLDDMAEAWTSKRLGRHLRGYLDVEIDTGLVPVKVSDTTHKKDPKLIAMQTTYKTCHDLGRRLRDTYGSDVNIVIYMANPFIEAAAFHDLCQCFRVINAAYLSPEGYQHTSVSSNLVLQIVPIGLIASSRVPFVTTPSTISRLAHEVYDRCQIGPNEVEIPSTLPISRKNSIVLAKPTRQNISFRVIAEPPADVLYDQTCVHVAYEIGRYKRWMSVAWTDDQGRSSHTALYRFKGQPLRKLLVETWETTLEIIRSKRADWRIMICKIGAITLEEFRLWKELTIAEIEKGHTSVQILTVSHLSGSFHNADTTIRSKIAEATATIGEQNNAEKSAAPTPQANLFSPGISSPGVTPTSAAFGISDPITTADSDPTARLIDEADRTWGVILPHGYNVSDKMTYLLPALASGYLVKRGAGQGTDIATCMEINLVSRYGYDPPDEFDTEHDYDTMSEESSIDSREDPQSRSNALLRETLVKYRNLNLLARLRHVEPEQSLRPLHVALAAKAVDAVERCMKID